MAHVAGHATHAANIRAVAERDPTVRSTWCEIADHRPDGRLERIAGVRRLRPFVDAAAGLRGARLDALLTNTPVVAALPRLVDEVPTVVDFDSTPALLASMPEYGSATGGGRLAGVRDRLARRLWSNTDVFQAWSRWAMASAIDDYGIPAEHVIVNPPGVDLVRWSPPDERAPSRARPLRILFVGGDFRRKGGDLLVDWYRRARPPESELHVVTREPVEATTGLVVHHDLTPNSDRLVALFRSSDLFVLPSRAECFGIATIEAMAAGLPVVVSDVGASSEIVEHGQNGLLVAAGDAAALGDAIAAILDDESRRGAMAAASRRIAEDRFDVTRNAARTIDVLKRIAGGSSHH